MEDTRPYYQRPTEPKDHFDMETAKLYARRLLETLGLTREIVIRVHDTLYFDHPTGGRARKLTNSAVNRTVDGYTKRLPPSFWYQDLRK